MSTSVEKIKEKLDVVDVIGSYLKLEKAGSSLKAKCPFHNEKTPSFFVSPTRGTYYCFGCGAKGDIFTFVQELEGLDFVGALKMLAEKAGVELEKVNPKERSEKDRLLEVLELSTRFFEKNLAEHDAASRYLLGRGLTLETIKSWRIGFALPEWRELHNYLKNLKVTDQEMEKAGLIKQSDKTKGEYYDVFRGRIIFPIFDSAGRIIAYSGRILVETNEAPKYLNSPETTLFSKSETLYGLDRAKVPIRKKDYSILVEGQVDLLMCHQHGFDMAVATSGTAFTDAHLLKLKRLSNRLLAVFDSDKAGFVAATKSATLALRLGMEVKLAALPKGSDPADMIYKDINGWKESLKNSKHLIDFYLDDLMSMNLPARKMGKEVEKKILPYIAMLGSSIEQSHFVSQVAKRTGIREEAIWKDLRNVPRGAIVSEAVEERKMVEKEVMKRRNYIEKRLFGIIFWQEKEKTQITKPGDIRKSLLDLCGKEYFEKTLAEYEGQKDELIFEVESYYEGADEMALEIPEMLGNLEEDILREKFVNQMAALEQAERNKDSSESRRLLEECQEITKRLAELSKLKIRS
jgi:DNA primase